MTNNIHLQPEDIQCAYSGKPGCACGCNGKYYYAKKFQAEAGKRRGYPVTKNEVNDTQIVRILNVIKENAAAAEVGSSYISVTVGNRVYTVYPNAWSR